jgi:serine/threonine protein kinase
VEKVHAGDPARIGPYRILGRLGSGGMGRVFLGRSGGGRLLAIKVIRTELAEDADFRARFGREVDAAKRVSGLFTAPVVDADVDATMPWLATAYVPGPSLAEAIASHGPLPASSVLALAAGLAEGLNAIHAADLVHRDLKPSNVLLADDGPRVIDFGISRAAEASALTGTGLVVGSPGFMSPEQADGREVGPPSDMFSLGAVLTFAGTGQGPFGTGPTAALLYRVVHNPPATGNLPEQVRLLVERCMHKDPRQRPTSAQLLSELEAAQPIEGWLPQLITEQLRPDKASGFGPTATDTPTGTPAPLAGEPLIERTPTAPSNIPGEPSTVTAANARAPYQGAARIPEPAPIPVTEERHAIPSWGRKRSRRTIITVIALPVAAAIAVVLALTLPGKPTSTRHTTAASTSGMGANLAAETVCQKKALGAAVVGSACFAIPQEYSQAIREPDVLTAYRYPPSCPNQNTCGILDILTGNAYDDAFAGRSIGNPDQQLGFTFSQPFNMNSLQSDPSCSSHLATSGTQPFGPKTAEYREWTMTCPKDPNPQQEEQVWRIPGAKILVVSWQPSALGSTSVQTMVAHASFIKEAPGILPPPVQLSPGDGSVFNNGPPRTTRLSWEAVSGATTYVVQIQACSANGCDASTSPSGPNINLPPYSQTVDGTSYSQNFVGAQPGRWRVAALKPDGELGQFSPWWGFTYTQ